MGFIAISIEVKFYERFSSIFYLISLIVLFAYSYLEKELMGFIMVSYWRFNLQPSEFVKITVALAVSKYISDFQTDLKNTIDQFKLFLIILIPIIIIIFQNDTGSSIVFLSLFFVLYREGISQNYVKSIFGIIILSILSLKISAPTTALLAILLIIFYYSFKKKVRNKIIKIISVSSLCVITCFGTIYSYENILKNHQKNI